MGNISVQVSMTLCCLLLFQSVHHQEHHHHHLGILLLPLDGMLVHHKLPPPPPAPQHFVRLPPRQNSDDPVAPARLDLSTAGSQVHHINHYASVRCLNLRFIGYIIVVVK